MTQHLASKRHSHSKGHHAQPKRISASHIFYRIYFALIAGTLGFALGGLFDILLSVGRALIQPHSSGDTLWFLCYLLGSVGALIGLSFGDKSGEFFAQLFKLDDRAISGVASELIWLVAKALTLIILGWSLFVLFL